MRGKLKSYALRCLLAADGEPMPEAAQIRAMQICAKPDRPSVAECQSVLRELEQGGWIIGIQDELTKEYSLMLTLKGKSRAQQL